MVRIINVENLERAFDLRVVPAEQNWMVWEFGGIWRQQQLLQHEVNAVKKQLSQLLQQRLKRNSSSSSSSDSSTDSSSDSSNVVVHSNHISVSVQMCNDDSSDGNSSSNINHAVSARNDSESSIIPVPTECKMPFDFFDLNNDLPDDLLATGSWSSVPNNDQLVNNENPVQDNPLDLSLRSAELNDDHNQGDSDCKIIFENLDANIIFDNFQNRLYKYIP